MKVFRFYDNETQYLTTADSITELANYIDEAKNNDKWITACVGRIGKNSNGEPLLIGWMTMVKAKNIRRIDNIKEQQFAIDIKKAFDEEC